MNYPQAAPAREGILILPNDPAAQLVESAHQIVTMIGANPRAIRPILAQRRLTKEQVLAAAADAAERAAASLAELDAAAEERRALHESTVRDLEDRLAAWGVSPEPDAPRRDDLPPEAADLRDELDAVNAELARFLAEQRRPRAFMATLRDRAAEVERVYGLL